MTNQLLFKVNQAALATTALTDLMYQLYCFDHDMPVYGSSLLYNGPKRFRLNLDTQSHDWSQVILVDLAFEAMMQSGGEIKASTHLMNWVLEVFSNKVVRDRAVIKHEQRIYAIESRRIWETEFNRSALQIEFSSDPCVPKGNVHYRYVYRYDYNKQYHISYRVEVGCTEDDFWAVNPYWFDYYGPEESEIGLIAYLDY
ncbi:hypothetical protein HNW13_017705 [Shewanella sp. BF02_Schw]|uniref:hypothetical protein n=1 Tax=Shewanella sp. BF02_Schw TaxID=394908 RepID=UPI00177AC0C7|nr:hypothetical protein [Shewanella sp. BF02_Schw]MBO1897575.1 hypothetical protein [Shewanella sp. BF02_Schw]